MSDRTLNDEQAQNELAEAWELVGELTMACKLVVARLEEYEDSLGGIALECARASIAKAERATT